MDLALQLELGSGLAPSAMSPQGSAWLLPRSQGHCFGGQTQASLFCSGIYPGSSINLKPGDDFSPLAL